MIATRIMILSAAFWAVAGITAGTIRSVQNDAPASLPESPEIVLTEISTKGDRLPLPPKDPYAVLAAAFSDHRVADELPPLTPAETDPPAAAERADELRLVEPQVMPAKSANSANSANRHLPHLPVDNICTRHGMHKAITRDGRSWRCRR
jgi:hypothetical protein